MRNTVTFIPGVHFFSTLYSLFIPVFVQLFVSGAVLHALLKVFLSFIFHLIPFRFTSLKAPEFVTSVVLGARSRTRPPHMGANANHKSRLCSGDTTALSLSLYICMRLHYYDFVRCSFSVRKKLSIVCFGNLSFFIAALHKFTRFSAKIAIPTVMEMWTKTAVYFY